MALIPLIQPPIMRLLTTKKEREVKMDQLREVSKSEKIVFPVAVTIITVLFLPTVAPLIGMLMLGNLFKESGVVERLSSEAQNGMINVVTIFLGTTVGATAAAETFLRPETLKIIALGLIAFAFSTVGGLLLGKLMCRYVRWKNKSSYWFGRSISSSNGGESFPNRRSKGKSIKLSSYACNGS